MRNRSSWNYSIEILLWIGHVSPEIESSGRNDGKKNTSTSLTKDDMFGNIRCRIYPSRNRKLRPGTSEARERSHDYLVTGPIERPRPSHLSSEDRRAGNRAKTTSGAELLHQTARDD